MFNTFNKWKFFTTLGAILLLLAESCFAITTHNGEMTGPWLTGPLIAYPGTNLAPGAFDVEPYYFYTKTFSPLRLYTNSPTLSYTQGLVKRTDLQLVIPYSFNQVEDVERNGFQDITAILGVQLLKTSYNNWMPNIKLLLEQVFPSGKFEDLNSSLPSVDSRGAGAYQTGVGLSIEQIYFLKNRNYLNVVFNLLYTIPDKVNVHGFNAYGGGFGADGVASPGNILFVDLAFEATLTRHVALAMDTVYMSQQQDTFTGNPGIDVDGLVATAGSPAFQEVTLAPAIEYNFNSHWGIIAGMWFSVYARNVNNFVSGVVALNYGS